MTVHEAPIGASVEWYTPKSLFDQLGIHFDLDVAAPRGGVPWVPADRYLTVDDNGLMSKWHGRVWCNPPYGELGHRFIQRMCEHRNGIALVPSRTETRWWQLAAGCADAVCFLRDRLHHVRPDGSASRSSFASCLFAWGDECANAVRSADLGWMA